MRVLYHITHRDNMYASRLQAEGYRDAFRDMGHTFEFVSIRDNFSTKLRIFGPDLLVTSIHLLPWIYRHRGVREIRDERRRGMVVGCFCPPWTVPGKSLHSLKNRPDVLRLARQGSFPDFFYSYFTERTMEEVVHRTGVPYLYVPDAANRLRHFPAPPSAGKKCDAVFVGNFLRHKRATFREYLDPLRERFDVRVIGHDWTWWHRRVGMLQSTSQALGLRIFDSLRKLGPEPAELRAWYASATVCLNFHSTSQRKIGEAINSRTFHIAACGGCQVCDDVADIRSHFDDSEIVVARDRKDFVEALTYFKAHPEAAQSLGHRASVKALAHHTFHHRAKSFIGMVDQVRARRHEDTSLIPSI